MFWAATTGSWPRSPAQLHGCENCAVSEGGGTWGRACGVARTEARGRGRVSAEPHDGSRSRLQPAVLVRGHRETARQAQTTILLLSAI
jgi:hypothetical protein